MTALAGREPERSEGRESGAVILSEREGSAVQEHGT